MTAALREAVRERAGNCCEYCHLPTKASILPSEMDHIIPEKHGGATEPANLALACCYCNRFKGPNLSGLDPVSGEMVRLFHPRQDAWHEHFSWEGVALVGRSPVGRATIQVLGINLPGHLRLREALAEEGLISVH
jgi:hypothetical protein